MACSSMNALCIGCGLSTVPRPSMVVTSCPLAADIGVTQERIGLPSRSTVQEPHCARPQPNFGPFNLRSSCSTYSSGVSDSTSDVWRVPLTVTLIAAIRFLYSSKLDDLRRGRELLLRVIGAGSTRLWRLRYLGL